jgi:hypothetical protein
MLTSAAKNDYLSDTIIRAQLSRAMYGVLQTINVVFANSYDANGSVIQIIILNHAE